MAFEVGNPGAGLRQQANEKLYRKALMLEIKDAGADDRALRRIAAAALKAAYRGTPWAVNHVAERIDGKVPQALVSDDDGSPMILQVVRYVVQPTDIPTELPITIEHDPSSSKE